MDTTQVFTHSPLFLELKDYLPVLSAFFGVLVGAGVAIYIGRLNFRAQTEIKYTIDSMNQLRDSVAECIMIMEMFRADWHKKGWMSEDEHKKSHERLNFLVVKIKLLLDPTIDEQHKLWHSIDDANRLLYEGKQKILRESPDKISDVHNKMYAVLQNELKRIKKG